MTNWTELKRLAEEAGGIEWHADMAVTNDGAESRAIYHRPKPYHAVEIIETPDSALDNADCIHSDAVWQFIAAANPKTILALIAENERLSQDIRMLVRQHMPLDELEGMPGWSEVVEARKAVEQRGQLRAEVEALRKDALRKDAELLDKLENTVKIGSRSVPPHDDDSYQGIYAFRTQLQGRSIRGALWSAIENEPAYMEYVRELNGK